MQKSTKSRIGVDSNNSKQEAGDLIMDSISKEEQANHEPSNKFNSLLV